MLQAMIDIGSNTIRMAVYEIKDGHAAQVMKRKHTVGLSAYVRNGVMQEEGIRRAAEVVSEYRDFLAGMGVKNAIAFTTAALVTSLVIEFIYLLLLAECLYWTVSLLVFDPARVGVLRMSRFIRRSRMRPHSGPFPAGKRKASMPAPTHESDASDLFSNHVRFRARQAAAASIAALFALTVVSCSTTGIDGNTINQDNPDRIASIENVAQFIDRI